MASAITTSNLRIQFPSSVPGQVDAGLKQLLFSDWNICLYTLHGLALTNPACVTAARVCFPSSRPLEEFGASHTSCASHKPHFLPECFVVLRPLHSRPLLLCPLQQRLEIKLLWREKAIGKPSVTELPLLCSHVHTNIIGLQNKHEALKKRAF